MKIIGKYKNGNYNVMILNDGTKIRYNNEENLIPSMPESMDIKINSICDMGCPMCFEGATINGDNGDILNAKFIETLHPFTEIAIGGGTPLVHPDLVKFLEKLKDFKMIPSITVHQNHFMKNLDFLHYLSDNRLIYGLGISMVNPTDDFISRVKEFPNAVIHVINGITTIDQLTKISYNDIKVLILGYKEFGRGKNLFFKYDNEINKKKNDLYESLPYIIAGNWFKAVSFDNLAIKQLDVKRLMDETDWDRFYMGNDGQYTMFIDLVRNTFSTSSTTQFENRHPILDNINDMFKVIRMENNYA